MAAPTNPPGLVPYLEAPERTLSPTAVNLVPKSIPWKSKSTPSPLQHDEETGFVLTGTYASPEPSPGPSPGPSAGPTWARQGTNKVMSSAGSPLPPQALSSNPFSTWRAVTPGSQLRVYGMCMCIAQMVAVCAFEAVGYFLIYRLDVRLLFIPLTVGAFAVATAMFGFIGLYRMRTWLLALHVAFSLTASTASAALIALMTFMLQERCSTAQSSWQGCSTCTCALKNTCTDLLISRETDSKCVTQCQAWGRDVCDNASTYQPAELVFACFTLITGCLASLFSLLLLIRLESCNGNLDNKVAFARNMLSHCLLEHHDLGEVEHPVVLELLRTAVAYGQESDVMLAAKVAVLLHVDTQYLLGTVPTHNTTLMNKLSQGFNHSYSHASELHHRCMSRPSTAMGQGDSPAGNKTAAEETIAQESLVLGMLTVDQVNTIKQGDKAADGLESGKSAEGILTGWVPVAGPEVDPAKKPSKDRTNRHKGDRDKKQGHKKTRRSKNTVEPMLEPATLQ